MDNNALNILLEERNTLISGFLTNRDACFPEKLTSLFDDYFCLSYEKSRVGPEMEMSRNPYALIALGGYGRKEQCIFSDVDLLFLFKNKVPDKTEDLIREIVYPLWDAGFEVGHATRTVKECIRMAGDDLEILMSLLDGRFICGVSNLFVDMLDGLRKKVIRSRIRKIIALLVDESRNRHRHYGDSSYLLEPNIKEGQGGLRDYHNMLWAARIKSDLKQPEDLISSGVIKDTEFRAIIDAVNFIRDVRNLLHYATNRKCDQLYLTHQARLAEMMQFTKKDSRAPVERFLGHLHGKMNLLKQQHQILFAELDDTKPLLQGRRIRGKRSLEKGLDVDKKNMLNFSSEDTVCESPELLAVIFSESSNLDLPLSAKAKRIIRNQRHLIDDDFRKNLQVIKAFESVLCAPPAAVNPLEDMLNTGFFQAFIPEMKNVENHIQYNEYHIYPTDKHLIKTVNTGKSFNANRFCYDMYNDLPDKSLFLWACLLHDIGKCRPERDHTQAGADIAETILKRHGYGRHKIDTVRFLIEEHLMLIRIATRRDIHDENTAIFCARQIKDADRLNMLYLLTVADAMSTGPKAWSDWSAALLRELYIKTHKLIRNMELAGIKSVEIVEKKKHDISQALSDNFKPSDIDAVLDVLSPRYLLYVHTPDILEHIQLYSRLKASDIVWEIKKDEKSGTRIISVCAKNKPGLFSKIAGVLTLNNINILDAQIYTWKNNIALDVFRVTPPKDLIFEEEIWKRVEKRLTTTLRHDVNLSIRIQRKIDETKHETMHTLKKPHNVRLDNESSDFFTIIEVYTYDFPGLLFSITDTLYKNGLDIYVAKIATKVDQVVDIFYVRNFYGEKVDTPEQIKEITSSILSVLPGTGSSPFHITPKETEGKTLSDSTNGN